VTDVTQWLDQHDDAGKFSPLELAQAQAIGQDQLDERKKVDREAAVQQQVESMLLAERAMGQPTGEMSRSHRALVEAEDECRELQAQLLKAEGKRDRARSHVEFWANRAQQSTAMAARSDLQSGVEGAVTRAQSILAAVAEEESRDIMARARARQAARPRVSSRSVSRPKAPGGQCVCGDPDCTAYPPLDDGGGTERRAVYAGGMAGVSIR
jgi:hypothetical protein